MSRHTNWVFKTEAEAKEKIREYRDHPYVSPGEPFQDSDGRWIVNVTLWECD